MTEEAEEAADSDESDEADGVTAAASVSASRPAASPAPATPTAPDAPRPAAPHPGDSPAPAAKACKGDPKGEEASDADDSDEDGARPAERTAKAASTPARPERPGSAADRRTPEDAGAGKPAEDASERDGTDAGRSADDARGSYAGGAKAVAARTDAEADTDSAGPGDADEPSAPDGDRSTRVLRPLVSDLYGKKPPEGGSGATVALGAPGTPTRARTAPQEPVKALLPPKLPAAPAPSAAPTTSAPERGGAAGAKPSAGASGAGAAVKPPVPAGAAADRAGASGKAAGAAAPAAAVEPGGPDGTRSMPVPPAGQTPLKLLAELTNTPPPPPSLMRAVVRRLKIWTPLVALLVVGFVVVQAVRPLPAPSLEATAAHAYTFAGAPLPQSMPWPQQGQAVAEVEGLGSLGVHGAQTPVPIASVTKVMTAYVILRDHPLSGKADGPMITVDRQAALDAASPDESTAPVKEGQRFSERQMLQLMLIPSGNNIARLLARWDSGTQEAFVTKMQQTAGSLGMGNTTYTGASGFESTTRSTAVDQLKLARVVMKNDVFRSVVALPNVTISGVGTIYNSNNDLVHYGVVGIKTGSSTPAGGALMWAARRTVDGKPQLILGVVLQQRGGTTVNDSLQVALRRSQALMDSVQQGLTSATIVKKGEVVGQVDDGFGGRTPVVASKDLKAIGWPGMNAPLTLTVLPAGLPHSAKAGTVVGTLSFGSGPATTSVPVSLQSDLHAPPFGKKLTRLG